MILLVTPSARARECAEALTQATTENTQVAASLRQAAICLRAQDYLAVVVDQSLLETEPDEGEILLQHLGTAMPVHVNFAISGIDRVVRDLRAALHRRQRELLIARRGAEQALRNELKSTLTALLLSCEMALQAPNLPAAADGKIRAACDLAREMRNKLGIQA